MYTYMVGPGGGGSMKHICIYIHIYIYIQAHIRVRRVWCACVYAGPAQVEERRHGSWVKMRV